MRRLLPGIAAATTLLIACGDPIQEAHFAGHPLAVLDGVIDQSFGPITPVPEGARIDLFWQVGDDWVQTAGPGLLAEDGIGWRIAVYAPPPVAARPSGWALGRVLPFRDDDGDGRRAADEPFLAVASASLVLWSASGLEPGEAGQAHALGPGVHRLVGYLSCNGIWRRGTASCASTFGQRCVPSGPGGEIPTGPDRAGDAPTVECDEGLVCQTADLDSTDNARCLYTAGECAPSTGRLVPMPYRGEIVARWMPACETDADCRDDNGCSAATGTCVDENQVLRVEVAAEPAEPLSCIDLRR